MSTAATDLPGVSGKEDTAPLRFVTAASLFDGHDAAINIMRRLIQAQGAEVIHLGHNRSVDDIVRAAIQEDADGIAVSSYQGGHNEFFRYMIDRLREFGADHIRVFGGGGGTITPEEIDALMRYGVERIYHPHDGMALGRSSIGFLPPTACPLAWRSAGISTVSTRRRSTSSGRTDDFCRLHRSTTPAAMRRSSSSRTGPSLLLAGWQGALLAAPNMFRRWSYCRPAHRSLRLAGRRLAILWQALQESPSYRMTACWLYIQVETLTG